MKILIDGDGCPVIDITIKLAKKYEVPVVIFCDTAHLLDKEGATLHVIGKGSDAVDFALVNEVKRNDLVITQDYGLAAMVLAKCGEVMNQDGMQLTDENIGDLLHRRHMGKTMRRQGINIKSKGLKKRQARQNEAFKAQLIRYLERMTSGNQKKEEVKE